MDDLRAGPHTGRNLALAARFYQPPTATAREIPFGQSRRYKQNVVREFGEMTHVGQGDKSAGYFLSRLTLGSRGHVMHQERTKPETVWRLVASWGPDEPLPDDHFEQLLVRVMWGEGG